MRTEVRPERPCHPRDTVALKIQLRHQHVCSILRLTLGLPLHRSPSPKEPTSGHPPVNVEWMADRPSIRVPEGDPPTDLLVEDETIGDGAEATSGKQVIVHYAGVAWSTGKEFDASWNRGSTFDFRLGGGQVIAGWDHGVTGMKVGGRRRLTIPPEMGYGSQGAGGVIKGGETLVFVVDLIDVR